jgi:hypothetical protein
MPDERLVAAVVDEGWWLNMPQRNTKTVEGITQAAGHSSQSWMGQRTVRSCSAPGLR